LFIGWQPRRGKAQPLRAAKLRHHQQRSTPRGGLLQTRLNPGQPALQRVWRDLKIGRPKIDGNMFHVRIPHPAPARSTASGDMRQGFHGTRSLPAKIRASMGANPL
jgi:hypothetical protein